MHSAESAWFGNFRQEISRKCFVITEEEVIGKALPGFLLISLIFNSIAIGCGGAMNVTRSCLAVVFCVIVFTVTIVLHRGKDAAEGQELEDNLKDDEFTGRQVLSNRPYFGDELCQAFKQNLFKIKKTSTTNSKKDGTKSHNTKKVKFLNTQFTLSTKNDQKLYPPVLDITIVFPWHPYKMTERDKMNEHKVRDVTVFVYEGSNGMTRNDEAIMQNIVATKGQLDANLIRGLSLPLKCVTQRLADKIVRKASIPNYGYATLERLSLSQKIGLFYKCKLDPSNLVMTLFPWSADFPTQKYLGACGKIVVNFDRNSKPLKEFIYAPWPRRVDLAMQLIHLAHMLTDNDSKFMLAIQRLTLDDFSVSESGRLFVNNASNIIIVDQASIQEEKEDHWNKYLQYNFISYNAAVPESQLCKYGSFDFNFFVVCKIMFGSYNHLSNLVEVEGLLHHPAESNIFKSEMYVLLDICVRGKKGVKPDRWKPTTKLRKLAIEKLEEMLRRIRPCNANYPYRFPDCTYPGYKGYNYDL